MERQMGVTLVELMVSAAILGILLLIAAPSMVNYFNDAKIRAVAEEIGSGLQQAKMAAIARNTRVEFVFSGSTGWAINATAVGATPQVAITSRTARSGEANIAITPAPALPASITIGGSSGIVFNGLGRVTPAVAYTLDITNPTNGACIAGGGPVRCLRVQISSTGMLKVCDPALAAADPRSC